MSIGEIIAILGLLFVILQTMIAWMNPERIRLSISSDDRILLLMILIASAFIVGGLFDASRESLFIFFTGNFLIIELMNFVIHKIPKKRVYFLLPLIVVIYGLIVCVSAIPVMSHLCLVRDFGALIIKANECLKQTFGILEVVLLMACLFFSFVELNLPSKRNNWNILRQLNFLACGIGVCLGLLFDIFLRF